MLLINLNILVIKKNYLLINIVYIQYCKASKWLRLISNAIIWVTSGIVDLV